MYCGHEDITSQAISSLTSRLPGEGRKLRELEFRSTYAVNRSRFREVDAVDVEKPPDCIDKYLLEMPVFDDNFSIKIA